MFIPGETITHGFYIPFTSEEVDKIYVTYNQNKRNLITKEVSSSDIEDETDVSFFAVEFSQAESLLFENDTRFKVQLNVILTDGDRVTSKPIDGKNGVQLLRKVVSGNE